MKAQYPVNISCQVLQVSTSGYFKWRRRRQDAPRCSGRAGQLGDQALLARIRAIHAQVKGEYGWPRMHHAVIALKAD